MRNRLAAVRPALPCDRQEVAEAVAASGRPSRPRASLLYLASQDRTFALPVDALELALGELAVAVSVLKRWGTVPAVDWTDAQ